MSDAHNGSTSADKDLKIPGAKGPEQFLCLLCRGAQKLEGPDIHPAAYALACFRRELGSKPYKGIIKVCLSSTGHGFVAEGLGGVSREYYVHGTSRLTTVCACSGVEHRRRS